MRFLIACVMLFSMCSTGFAVERKPLKNLIGKAHAVVCRSCR